MKIDLLVSQVSLLWTLWTLGHSGQGVLAAPSVHRRLAIEANDTLSEACYVGYCTQNGGTTGGSGGATIIVSTLQELAQAALAPDPAVIIIQGQLIGDAQVQVSSNKTILGASGSSLIGIGLTVKRRSNVILRNLSISKVLASRGDAISIQAAQNVWVDHCDLSSDLEHDKDYYDGLCDVTHGSEWITISNSYFHDHFKASLIGHSDGNAMEDKGHLHVTFAGNYWRNVNSRAPSFRFGTGHIFNSYFANLTASGINTRMGAELLIESCVFAGPKRKAIESTEGGFATVSDVELGTSSNTAPAGSLTAGTIPYAYELLGSPRVKDMVLSAAGQTLNVDVDSIPHR